MRGLFGHPEMCEQELFQLLFSMRHDGRGVPPLPKHRTGGAVAHRKWKRARASGRR